jgi:hypothetical protein
MAAPQVSGVAALCWAVAPDASVADVRNAILHGADPVAALSGKVASGGTLDAYKTLQLLSAAQPQGPVVSSLTAAPGSVVAGAALTLSAGGITDAAGTVTQVLFYRDANNNGQYDATDPLVASTTALSGGTANVTVSTAGLAAGTYRYFAKAVDNHSRSSAMASATMSVLASDDFGNTAATAGAIAAPSATSGKLEVAGDTDWFKFQAVAGKSYTFSTQLGTLRDSVLSLYDRNGQTRLAFNDDYGSGLASRIISSAAMPSQASSVFLTPMVPSRPRTMLRMNALSSTTSTLSCWIRNSACLALIVMNEAQESADSVRQSSPGR